MFDGVVPGWHTTIYPFYYIVGYFLSVLAMVLFFGYVLLKIFKVSKDQYQPSINLLNLVVCILNSVLVLIYLFELIMTANPETYQFMDRVMGNYYFIYLFLLWLPMLLALLFWKKKNRINLNLSILILFALNLGFWLEGISIIVMELM